MTTIEFPAQQFALHELELPAGEEQVIEIGRTPGASYSSIEMVVLSGTSPIYWVTGGSSPLYAGAPYADVFPAAIGSVQIPLPGYGGQSVTLRLISRGYSQIALVRR